MGVADVKITMTLGDNGNEEASTTKGQRQQWYDEDALDSSVVMMRRGRNMKILCKLLYM